MNIFKYFIYILPLALISGPFVPDLIVVILSFFILYQILVNKELFLFKNFFSYIFCIFYFCLISSSLLSENLLFSLNTSIFYIRFLFLALTIYFFSKIKNFEKNFSYSLFFCFVILFFDSNLQYFFNIDLFNKKYHDNLQISSFFGSEQILGSYLMHLYPLSTILMLTNNIKNNSKSIFFFAYSIITFITIVISGERTALIIFLINFFLINFFIYGFNIKKNIIILFAIILVFSSLILTNNFLKKRMIDNFFYQIFDGRNATYKNITIFSKQHTLIYQQSIEMFEGNFFLGIGPKMFRIYCDKEKYRSKYNLCTTHPHNFFIQILLETGIVGFLFYMLFIYLLVRIVFDPILSIKTRIIAVSVFFNFFFPLRPYGNFFNNWLSIINFIPISFLISNYFFDKKFLK
jgi:O-antigen ligase